jgi:transaldolase
VVISPPFEWQVRCSGSTISVQNRMDEPVDLSVVAQLEDKFEDFRRAYHENGMKVEEFDDYGATRRTLRQFCKATEDLVSLVRDYIIPNPDI